MKRGGAQNHAPAALAEATVNTALWTVQGLWGAFVSLNGFGKGFGCKPAPWNPIDQSLGTKEDKRA